MVEMYKSKYGSIEKLSSSNYDTWKPLISAILSAILAFKIVTGEETEDDLPVGNSPANIAKRESYEKRQALATAAILLSCTHEVSTYLSGITDPKAMWDTLAEQLSSVSSFGRRVTVGRNFNNARPKTGESISAYLTRLNDMRVLLAGTEGAISDEKFLYHIYLTAPEQYQPILDTMRGLPAGMATIASVSRALRDAEQNKPARKANEDGASGTALFARGRGGRGRGKGRGGRGNRNGGRGGRSGKGRGKQPEQKIQHCSNCNMNNHTTENCCKSPKSSKRPYSAGDDIVCYYCAETGHPKKLCPVWKRVQETFNHRNPERALLANGVTDEIAVPTGYDLLRLQRRI